MKPKFEKAVAVFACFIWAVSLCACGGEIKNAKTREVASVMYTQADIEAAIETILIEFEENWNGCSLTEIYYSGDETSRAYQDLADGKDADEVIVLLSSFDVDSSGGDGSLNPNSTYRNWKWILVRKTGGRWQHVDHGY